MTTRLTDVIIPERFSQYVSLLSTEVSSFWQSGIVMTDARLAALVAGGGRTFNMPFWEDLANTEANVSSDDPGSSATPEKIQGLRDIGVRCVRNQHWEAADLTGLLAGSDPMGAIAAKVGGYWQRQHERMLVAQSAGIVASGETAEAGSFLVDVATDDAGAITDAERLTPELIFQGEVLMTDQANTLVGIVMHPVVRANLKRQNLLVTTTIDAVDAQISPGVLSMIPAQAIRFESFQGMRIILNRNMTATAGSNRVTYRSYAFGSGAYSWGDSPNRTPVEIERDSKAADGEGLEDLASRVNFCLHPKGYQWTGTPAGESPTNAELGTGTNWAVTNIAERERIQLVAFDTNG